MPQNRSLNGDKASTLGRISNTLLEDWLTPGADDTAGAAFSLVVFPHAGGAPSAYRRFAELLAPDVRTHIVHLPGRERRFAEPPPESLPAVIRPVADAVGERVRTPYAMVGHSMGALLAFETARRLRRLGGPAPRQLVVSAFAAPDRAVRLDRGIARHRLGDTDLLQWLNAAGGIPAGLLADESLMELLLPAIRADLRLCETYRHISDRALDCPITAFAARDDRLVDVGDVASWERHTTAGFDLHVVDGGHFFPHADPVDFVGRLRARIDLRHPVTGGNAR